MKPKELLSNYLESLSKDLIPLGFKLAKSTYTFKRNKNGFAQEITFCSSRYNSEDLCEFWVMLGVKSKEYSQWHNHTYGIKPINNAIWGTAEWNLENWKSLVPKNSELKNNKKDRNTISKHKQAILEIALPNLNKFSNHENAISHIQEYDRVKTVNILRMIDQEEKAKFLAEQFIHEIENGAVVDQMNDLKKLKELMANWIS